MKQKKDIGIEVTPPKNKCDDKHCPFHSNLKLRGRSFTGKIISKDTHKSAVIEFPRLWFIRKYERYEKRRTRLKVHNPPCINASIGNEVVVMECKPISKSKNYVIIGKK